MKNGQSSKIAFFAAAAFSVMLHIGLLVFFSNSFLDQKDWDDDVVSIQFQPSFQDESIGAKKKIDRNGFQPKHNDHSKNNAGNFSGKQSKEESNDNQLSSSQKNTADNKKKISQFRKMIKSHLVQYQFYPFSARANGLEGTVQLQFLLLSNGQTRDIRIMRSSGFTMLDQSAVKAVKQANPFPRIPEKFQKQSILFQVHLVYNLRYNE